MYFEQIILQYIFCQSWLIGTAQINQSLFLLYIIANIQYNEYFSFACFLISVHYIILQLNISSHHYINCHRWYTVKTGRYAVRWFSKPFIINKVSMSSYFNIDVYKSYFKTLQVIVKLSRLLTPINVHIYGRPDILPSYSHKFLMNP